jgi:hypothetical protein
MQWLEKKEAHNTSDLEVAELVVDVVLLFYGW